MFVSNNSIYTKWGRTPVDDQDLTARTLSTEENTDDEEL